MISFQNARVEMKIMSFGSKLYVNGILEQVFWFWNVLGSFRVIAFACQLENSMSTYKQEVLRLVTTQISKTHMFCLVTCF